MNYTQLLEHTTAQIIEIMPWDFIDYLAQNKNGLVVDVRETHEYDKLRLQNTLSVPRGILESACSWGFNETVPELAAAKQKPVLLVCRSGHRSAFAALVMQLLGFEKVTSLKLGLKGLNDEDYPIFDSKQIQQDADLIETWLNPEVLAEQRA